MRQRVLSLPFALRYRLASDARLASAVLAVFVRAAFASLRRRARRRWGLPRSQCGAVTFVQRFGDALNLNRHFHSPVLDGVCGRDAQGRLRNRPKGRDGLLLAVLLAYTLPSLAFYGNPRIGLSCSPILIVFASSWARRLDPNEASELAEPVPAPG